jgi:hypothetical protein
VHTLYLGAYTVLRQKLQSPFHGVHSDFSNHSVCGLSGEFVSEVIAPFGEISPLGLCLFRGEKSGLCTVQCKIELVKYVLSVKSKL